MSNLEAVSPLHRSIDLIERYAKCVLRDSKSPVEISKLKELGPYILFFSNVLESNQAKEKIFDDFVNMIDSSTEELNSEDVLQEFSERVKNSFKKQKKCERYVNFMNLISEINSNSDDEIETVAQTVNLIDPISKLPIVEPVKNKNCGHVYDKNTIKDFLKKYPKTKCPVAGCVTTDYIKKTDLIPE